jgi:hypothetical protein
VTKLILKSQRNLLENTNKEATWKTAIPMKNVFVENYDEIRSFDGIQNVSFSLNFGDDK